MATNEGGCSVQSKPSRPTKLSLQQVLEAVLESDGGAESEFGDSSLEEESQSESDVDDNSDQPLSENDDFERQPTDVAIDVSSYSSGFVSGISLLQWKT